MCPTLAIFGSADPWTPAADIDALRAAWSDRPDCEIVVVEGADHGFVHDPDRPGAPRRRRGRVLGPGDQLDARLTQPGVS